MSLSAYFLMLSLYCFSGKGAPNSVMPTIASIEVETTGSISRGVVLGAARIKVGDEASDENINAAVARINRLPFVLDVTYELNPGHNGEGSALVLNVTVKRPYEIDFSTDLFRSSEFSGSEQRDTVGLIGRYFVGPGQLLSMAVEPDWSWGGSTFTNGSVRLRYEHFNLFKRGFYLRAEIEQQDEETHGASSYSHSETDYEPTYQLETAVPLGGDHRLHLTWTRAGSSYSRETGSYIYDDTPVGLVSNERRSREQEWNLSWRHDTRDSDFAPRSGSLFATTYRHFTSDLRYTDQAFGGGRSFDYLSKSDSDRFEVAYRRHMPVSPRRSWFYGATAASYRSDVQWPRDKDVANPDGISVVTYEYETQTYRAFAGFSWDLFQGGRMSRYGGLRLDLLGGGNYRRDESKNNQPDGFNQNRNDSDTIYEIKANMSYRLAWGTFGLGLTYNIEP